MSLPSAPSLGAPLPPETEAGARACAAVDDVGDLLAAEADRVDGAFASASVRALAEAGVLAACAPVDDGGYGLTSLYDLAVLVARIARHDASVAVAAHMHLVLSWYYARTVRLGAGDEQWERHRAWIRAVGRREMIVCSSVAEVGGSSWRPHATARPHGTGWVIDGRKLMASISPAATHFYAGLRAETEDGPQQASAMIPAALPGVSVLDDWDGFGLRGSGSGRVHFDGVSVDRDVLVTRGPWGVRDDRSLEGRVASAAPLIGVTVGIAEAAVAAAGAARRGDGDAAPSSRAATVRAELEVGAVTCRGVLSGSLRHFDGVLGRRAPRTLTADESRALMKECVCSALVAERAAATMVDLAMEACGSRSFRAGHVLARLCRDVRASFFMRPYAPADQWVDFVSGGVPDRHGANGGPVAPRAEEDQWTST